MLSMQLFQIQMAKVKDLQWFPCITEYSGYSGSSDSKVLQCWWHRASESFEDVVKNTGEAWRE
jgi:hypothetical protein